ncbi:phosphate ABC transporter substrate-binding protein [Burkholderia ubonensis]|uniref:Phosphate ABC transporter substrate-binding protein n=1 Tax=Burkholderia ubonensis TaxID=101571 RepID=A0AAW3N7T8_9BURK|nr:substrate-binding domain-containing protein [Burkholderia ubonensis]KVQ03014.1 phosphate ABC transporter substrate-binding protein [Burkholderia ubonensis]KVZ95998.1 phosphate ABC transporter substrate-binding protein [Burkholderia ubonensis]KWD57427.1 phosphate ABC transporter substrate-binding protein [Burkholderia ubonensis]KWD62527.1 phosphate ABC transporter substrate-binding protein [Burkholderia ubonensis]
MRLHQRKLCQIITLLVSGMGASAAMAVTNVQGGGSSLVAPMIGLTGNPATELGLFGTAEGSFTYYPFGSGAGQNAFLNNQPTFFGAGVTGTVHFANSDAALTTAQLTAYKAGLGATSGPLIQIPYIVTPITVPVVNGPAVTSTTTPQTTPGQAHSIALNDNDLCGIFSGKLTNWNQVINPETITTSNPTGNPYTTTSMPIKVIYRSDGSGTTELLTRHLAAVCTTFNTQTGVTFFDSMTFTALFPGWVPSNFVAARGDSGVRSALISLASAGTAAVAYLGPSHTNTYLAPSSSAVISASAFQLPVASLVNAKNGVYYAPTYANASTALGTIAAPPTRFMASNQANWVPNVGNPASGYPVSGTSQIILSQCYADASVKTAVHDFLNSHYTNASFASIVHGNGFDTVPSNYQTAISNDFLSNAYGFNLDIGNASVCTGTVTGR